MLFLNFHFGEMLLFLLLLVLLLLVVPPMYLLSFKEVYVYVQTVPFIFVYFCALF